VAQQTVQTPKNPVKTAVWFDLQGIAATTNDVVLVRASLLDRNNNVVPTDSSPVTFRVASGPGELIGTNPVNAEAGIATILLRTTGVKGAITISAVAENVTREGSGTITPRDP
jgi:beta-galactosidase